MLQIVFTVVLFVQHTVESKTGIRNKSNT